jgi:23S rRNA pseudouridine2605 synthase
MTDKGKNEKAGDRIAKRIAQAGICSRRDAERWIAEGRVKVNGVVLKTPATLVTDRDMVMVDGKKLKAPDPVRLFRFHKPVGLVTTASDELGRPTVFEGLPEELPRMHSIGRLDVNSEGLLLLTSDGELKRYLELPARGFDRIYRVRVFGTLDEERLDRLKNGINIDGVRYGPIEIQVKRGANANSWLMVKLQEGKNREIRRVLGHLGLQVNRLIRERFGPFELGDLPKGALVEIPRGSFKKLLPGFTFEKPAA